MKKMSKRIATGLLVTGLVVLGIDALNNMRPKQESQEPVSSETIQDSWSVPVPVRLKSLNPQKVVDSVEKGVLSTVFSRLITVNGNLEIQSDLLEKWEHDLSQKRYILTIRDAAKFASGKPVTAKDIIFSFHYWAKKGNFDSTLLSSVEDLKELSPKVVEVKLRNWSDRFILDLAMPRFCIYPENFSGRSETAFFANPDGSGPFKVVTLSSDGTLELEANENYFLGKPGVKKLKIHYMSSTDAIAAFNLGTVDNLIFYKVESSTQIHPFQDLVDTKARNYKTLTLIVNPEADADLASAEARRKLLTLIDRSAIVEKCFPGDQVASNLIPRGLVGSGLESAPPASTQAPLALEKLSKPKTVYIESSVSSACIASALNSHMENAGIEVKELEFEKLFERFKAKKLSLWIELLEFKNEDPFSALQYFWEASSEYLIGVKDRALASLFSQITLSKTYAEKASLYREIDRLLVEKNYILPLVYPSARVVYRGSVTGLSFSGNRDALNNWHEIRIKKVSP